MRGHLRLPVSLSHPFEYRPCISFLYIPVLPLVFATSFRKILSFSLLLFSPSFCAFLFPPLLMLFFPGRFSPSPSCWPLLSFFSCLYCIASHADAQLYRETSFCFLVPVFPSSPPPLTCLEEELVSDPLRVFSLVSFFLGVLSTYIE